MCSGGKVSLVKPGITPQSCAFMSSFKAIEKNDPRSSQKVGRGILVSWGSYVTPPWEICGCGNFDITFS